MIRKLQQMSGQTVGSKQSLLVVADKAVVRSQQASQIGFSVATTFDSNVVDFLLSVVLSVLAPM